MSDRRVFLNGEIIESNRKLMQETLKRYFGETLTEKILTNEGELTGDNMVAVKCVVKNLEGRVVGSGLAYEHKDNGPVNKLSALENCETSAIGRALASMGLAGGEYASGDEINSIEDKEEALWRDEFPLGLMSVLTTTDAMDDKEFMKFNNNGEQKIWFCKYLGQQEMEHYVDIVTKRKQKIIEQQEKK